MSYIGIRHSYPRFCLYCPIQGVYGRLPGPTEHELIYCALEDVLKEYIKGMPWTWCEVRPDAIVRIRLHRT
jgi:hypothetical protein